MAVAEVAETGLEVEKSVEFRPDRKGTDAKDVEESADSW